MLAGRMMTEGEKRRMNILEILENRSSPVPGTELAGRLGVSRQTISKWETDETLPDIRQSKILASLYRLSLDELICFDAELQEIRRTIDSSSPERDREVDWTALWAQKYPVLASYRQQVRTEDYAAPLQVLLDRLKREQGYSELDAFLVLKDILGTLWTRQEQQL